MSRIELPIDAALGEIVAASREHAAIVVEAPPGAGKTTRVSPALLGLLGSARQRIVLVQPRRIAARTAATRIASELGVNLGREVGFQVRFDHQVSAETRIAVMTPGVLIRQLQTDSVLSQVAIVVLDEFHERSLEYDLLLGMVRRVQQSVRPELRLVVMSATLNTSAIVQYLEQPPVVRLEGKLFPIAIRHARPGPPRKIVDATTEAISKAVEQDEGDMLVFLPGVGEILQVLRNLETTARKANWDLLPLYGDLPTEQQDRVLAPSQRRKIILATNVAETSLTIEGVRIVIDSGWARVERVDPAVGLNRLELEPISKASAAQRAGRAGRTAPGVCYRLWDEITHRSRPDHTDPEILRVDLSAAVLQLACWGETDALAFPWITPPRQAAIDQANLLLERIDAIDAGQPTRLGRQLIRLPVHPRLACFLVAGHRLGIPQAAALGAALLSERDVFDRRGESAPDRSRPRTQEVVRCDCDLTQRLLALENFLGAGQDFSPYGMVRPAAARQVERVASQLFDHVVREFGRSEELSLDDRLQRALLSAFPDRLAKRREPQKPRGLMVGGKGVKLDARSGVTSADLFLCIDVDASASEASVRQASAVDRQWLDERHLRCIDERFMHPTQGYVAARRRTYWLDLAIDETPIETPLDDETARLLASAAVIHWHKVFPSDDKSLNGFVNRARWLSAALNDPTWPNLTDEGLQKQLAQWCWGLKSLDEVRKLPWLDLLRAMLNSQQHSQLAREAPESFTLPRGRQVRLQYEVGKPPILAAKIQEFFGLAATPRLAGGRVPLLLHLLAPNNRCQQITDDLTSFWKNTYSVVRKELRRRYPKHAWPENPLLP